MRDRIIELLEDMSNEELLNIHREYIYASECYDDEIFSIDRIDEICEGQDAYWIACRAYYGDFRPADPYFKFDGYGNFKSLCEFEIKEYIDIEEITDYIIDNNNALYNDDIQEILDE